MSNKLKEFFGGFLHCWCNFSNWQKFISTHNINKFWIDVFYEELVFIHDTNNV